MKIWVDADACPAPVKEIIYRAANRMHIHTTLVANHHMKIPKSQFIGFKLVEPGFDVADDFIETQIVSGDLVITNDLPLASAVLDASAVAISTRGELFTQDNIKQRLAIRDFMDTLRASGIHSGGPAAMSQADIKAFADTFDKLLTQQTRNK